MKWLELGEFCSGKGPRKITAIQMLVSFDIFGAESGMNLIFFEFQIFHPRELVD